MACGKLSGLETHPLRPLHTRDREPVTVAHQALSLVEKEESVQVQASHYAWGTNGVSECKMYVKSTWIPTWHRMGYVSWSLGLFSKTMCEDVDEWKFIEMAFG